MFILRLSGIQKLLCIQKAGVKCNYLKLSGIQKHLLNSLDKNEL